MSKKIKKPIPHSRLHDCDDEMLDMLVSLNRGRIELNLKGEKKYNKKKCVKKIQNIYKIFGYRTAVECFSGQIEWGKDGD